MSEAAPSAVLSTAGLGLRIRGVTIVDGVTLDGQRGRAARHHRAQRRREDDAVQPALGGDAADVGYGDVPR